MFFVVNCFFKLPPTEKVFAKCGQNLTESSILTNRSKLLFRGTKLLKKLERKASCGKILQIVQLACHPAFCKYYVICSYNFFGSLGILSN